MYPTLVFESRPEKTPGATCKLHVRIIKMQINCGLINAFVVRYLESMIT